MLTKRAGGHLAAIITILIWGTTFISTKILLCSFSPFTILATRFVIGYAALFLWRPGRLRLPGRARNGGLWRRASVGSPCIICSRILP